MDVKGGQGRSDRAGLVPGCDLPIHGVALRGPTWEVPSPGHDAPRRALPSWLLEAASEALFLGGTGVLLSLYLRACGGAGRGGVPRVTASALLSASMNLFSRDHGSAWVPTGSRAMNLSVF